MKIAIVGAGPAGAYLAYLLRHRDVDVTVYDKDSGYELGSRCACGVNPSLLKELLTDHPEIVDDNILFEDNEVEVTAGNYHTVAGFEGATIDKNKLIKEMLKISGAEILTDVRCKYDILTNEYFPSYLNAVDLVIDATGVNRALLGKVLTRSHETLMGCYSYLCKKDRAKAPMWKAKYRLTTRGTGYIWEFPWSDDLIHVGCGILEENPRKVVEEYMQKKHFAPIVEGEGAAVRLSSPYNTNPKFCFEPNITIGIGEAIGTVSPLSGEGIIPSMESAAILYSALMDNETLSHGVPPNSLIFITDYLDRVREHYTDYRREYKVVQALMDKELLKGVWHGMKLPRNAILKQSKFSRLRTLIGGIRDAKKRYN